ncbi:MAG: transposase, partial [Romboutsia sp.]|nr:transposase [Romboutsia sp.]
MTKKSEEKDTAYRTIQFVVKEGHPLNEYFMDLMYKSNNLYNATNFHIRQLWTALNIEDNKKLHPLQQEVIDLFKFTIPKVNKNNTEKFEKLVKKDILNAKVFNSKKKRKVTKFNMPTKDNSFCNYELMDAVFKTSKNSDYNSLPAQVNQAVMKQVYSAWSSYFDGINEYKINPSKFTGKPKPPRYKTKGATNSLTFSNQVCTVKDGKYLRFPKTTELFNLSKHLLEKIDNNKLVQVRVQKFYNNVKLEVVLDYSKQAKPLINVDDIKNVMAIDLGVNNLATCVSNNGMQPTIINGRALKSINQYYNKLRAKLYSDLRIKTKKNEGNSTSKRLEYIDMKRFFKVKDFLHKASKQ